MIKICLYLFCFVINVRFECVSEAFNCAKLMKHDCTKLIDDNNKVRSVSRYTYR